MKAANITPPKVIGKIKIPEPTPPLKYGCCGHRVGKYDQPYSARIKNELGIWTEIYICDDCYLEDHYSNKQRYYDHFGNAYKDYEQSIGE